MNLFWKKVEPDSSVDAFVSTQPGKQTEFAAKQILGRMVYDCVRFAVDLLNCKAIHGVTANFNLPKLG